jgi:predicted Rossmann-fold nucleotide-binding protein
MLTQHWVLVAGTGRQHELPASICALAKAIGSSLGDHAYGLVVGGWPGVDHVTSSAYADAVKRRGVALSDNLIQVVGAQRPIIFPEGTGYPDFKGGHVVVVPQGAREWIEAIKYCDAVILLGGEGGTLETFHYALQEQRPVFPVFSTGGDAKKAFEDCIERWDTLPFEGISRSDFETVLSKPALDSIGVSRMALGLFELLHRRFAYEAVPKPVGTTVFVSYAHEDRQWLTKLRSVLRPLEQSVAFAVWDDQSMRPGAAFEVEIAAAIATARVAILLVSDAFLRSSFILDKELPWLLERLAAGTIAVLWLRIDGDGWKNSALASVLAASENVEEQPLASLPPAVQQDALVRIRRHVVSALGR